MHLLYERTENKYPMEEMKRTIMDMFTKKLQGISNMLVKMRH